MRNAVLFSAGLHVAVIVLTVAGLPSLFDSDPVEVVPIAVELVTFTEAEKPPPEPKAKPAPKPELPREPPEPPPAPATAEPPPPEPIAEPLPAPTPPEPAPKPVVKAKPKPKPKPKLKLLARKVVVPQPRSKPRPPPDEFQKLLKNLKQEKKLEDKKREIEKPPIALVLRSPPVPSAPRPPSPLEQRMLAATLSQEVMRQVTPCWSIPAGVKDAHTIRVGVRIYLKPDGHLSGPPEVEDSKRMRSDLAFRAVAESALRALRNPRCSPLRLPLKSFETWREISFNFDPRELLR